jgi:diphthamide synthase (EF-2-diphthine--ammonia ligase)
MLKAYKHQAQTTAFELANPRCFDTSDPGTGKTRAALDAVKQIEGRTLVLAPLSILQPSWAADAATFTPELTVSIAYAKNRATAFAENADITVTNHDAVKWIAKQLAADPTFLDEYTTLIVDEFPAFKNRTTGRSKAALKIAKKIERIILMSGTPNSNGIINMWHPTMMLDGGDRLGKNFFQFRSNVSAPVQVGPEAQMVNWVEKEEAISLVGSLLADITIRHELEACIDMPENKQSTMYTALPAAIQKKYQALKDESILFTEGGVINAVHAGARVKKLLQLVTGAVYDEHGDVHCIHSERYELVISLCEAREHTLVAFNWKHERNKLVELATKKGMTYAVIDGDTSIGRREKIVSEFQAGKIQVLFAHPQSAAHGLTLTRAKTTIWCSPTYNAEHFQQFNRRIYRAGQMHRTETILIAAEGTWETEVYERLGSKLAKLDDLLSIFSSNTNYQHNTGKPHGKQNHRTAQHRH